MSPKLHIWFWIAGSLVAALLVAGFVLGVDRGRAGRWLEENTGETYPPNQINGLLWRIAQRETATADHIPVAHADVSPYGTNTFFEQEVEERKLRSSMEMLRDAGVRWIRQQIPWDRIEIPEKGRFESPFGGSSWDSYDRFIDMAGEYDLEIVARLDLPPEWARREKGDGDDEVLPQSPPENFRDYGDFVYAFASRYKDQIDYYQIWNEPNLFSEWGAPVNAARYVELLEIGSTAVRSADPGAIVLSAALGPTLGTPDGLNQDDLSYLQEMYDAGAAEYFDILSVQGHGLWTGPGDARVAPSQTNIGRLELIREVMVRNGDADKSIWVSELGWNALPDDFPGEATHGRVSLDRQARYTVQAYERAAREWPWVGVLFYWHFRRVHEENRVDVEFYYRMVDPDFTVQPVYDAYREMTAAPGLIGPGWHEETNWAVRYGGAWRAERIPYASLQAATATLDENATMRFRFEGTGISLAVVGVAGGGLVDAVVRDESGAVVRRLTLDLETPIPTPSVVSIARRLPAGRYDFELSVTTTGRPVVIDGVLIDNSPLEAWLPLLAIALLIAAAAILLGLVRSVRARNRG